MTQRAPTRPNSPPTPHLSPRCLQVLQHMARGLTNLEIAAALYLGEGTVKRCRELLFERLGARNRAHAVHLGHLYGLLGRVLEPGLDMVNASAFNERHPVGTPVTAYPGGRSGPVVATRTRTPAWELGNGTPVVSVDGYAGGIALTHIDVTDREAVTAR